jgi:hypothetical protein
VSFVAEAKRLFGGEVIGSEPAWAAACWDNQKTGGIMNAPAAIKFTKTIQTAKYESEGLEIEVSGSAKLSDTDNFDAVVDALRFQAYKHLGRVEDFKPVADFKEPEVPVERRNASPIAATSFVVPQVWEEAVNSALIGMAHLEAYFQGLSTEDRSLVTKKRSLWDKVKDLAADGVPTLGNKDNAKAELMDEIATELGK